jgi:hypothetical protein
VTSPGSGATGINCFLHRHGCLLGIDASWDNKEVDRVVYDNPGTLVAQTTSLPPGGNNVLSYLDVIAEDSTPPVAIAQALQEFGALIGTEDFPMAKVFGGVAVRFSLVLGLKGKEEFEYPALEAAVSAIAKKV